MKAETLAALRSARAGKRSFVIVTALEGGAQAWGERPDALAGALTLTAAERTAVAHHQRDDKSGVEAPEDRELFIQVWAPPLRLVLVGAVHIAQPLAPMAAMAGYDVTVVDPRGSFATADRFPGVSLCTDWPDDAIAGLGLDSRTAIVTLTHDPKLDDPALDAALRSQAFYIGALGSRKTHAKRVERLRTLGHGEAALARIHGPVGLNIGAASPQEIAISILAEITAALRSDPPARDAAA
ncbi:MAG: XdhC family protein [Alphaproteobacteria bacterium]